VDEAQLLPAARDFRFLLGHGYPQQASLELVGNRYALPAAARQLLHRGVFAPVVAAERRRKLSLLGDLPGRPLALDGHNVVITLESALRGIPVLAADDGFIRDIGQVSHAFRFTSLTAQVLQRLGLYLAAQGAGPVQVWYDRPMSRSGDLAAATRRIWQDCGLMAEAQAVPVPEKKLLEFAGVIDSSDTAVIDRIEQVVDVAGEIIRQLPRVRIIALAGTEAAES
jgi:hypothetical protein